MGEQLKLPAARLPANYVAACEALRRCAEHDEYADVNGETLRTNPERFAEALASYARQADDDTIERAIARIKRRARRELAKAAVQP